MNIKKTLYFFVKLILWAGYTGILFVNFISIPIYDCHWLYLLYILTSALLAIAIPTIIWRQSSHIEKLYKLIEQNEIHQRTVSTSERTDKD